MHESAKRLVDEIVNVMTRDLPGEMTRIDVFTSEDASRQFSHPKFYALVGGVVEKHYGVVEVVPETPTHNERSARRQAVARGEVSHEVSETVNVPEEAEPEPESDPES